MKEVVQNEYCRLMQILNIATDIGEPRRRPVVPIATIIRVLLQVPLAGTRSMLRLDHWARMPLARSLFRNARTPIVSDSTIQRVLPLVKPDDTKRTMRRLLPEAERRGLLTLKLPRDTTQRRLGILDGTCMGGYWYTIHAVAEEFAGFPVRVLRVSEDYSASQTSRTAQRTFWVATTDMSLSPEAAREAAHLRWTIEKRQGSGLYRLSVNACTEPSPFRNYSTTGRRRRHFAIYPIASLHRRHP